MDRVLLLWECRSNSDFTFYSYQLRSQFNSIRMQNPNLIFFLEMSDFLFIAAGVLGPKWF